MQNELLGIGLLVCVASVVWIACFPLFKFSRQYVWLALACFLGVCIAYLQWGGYFALSDHHAQLVKEREVNEILASPEKTAALIQRIIAQLDDTPQSASGWFLVGKLYMTHHQYSKAKAAFEKAVLLKHQT